jgi:hypothetical protein
MRGLKYLAAKDGVFAGYLSAIDKITSKGLDLAYWPEGFIRIELDRIVAVRRAVG